MTMMRRYLHEFDAKEGVFYDLKYRKEWGNYCVLDIMKYPLEGTIKDCGEEGGDLISYLHHPGKSEVETSNAGAIKNIQVGKVKIADAFRKICIERVIVDHLTPYCNLEVYRNNGPNDFEGYTVRLEDGSVKYYIGIDRTEPAKPGEPQTNSKYLYEVTENGDISIFKETTNRMDSMQYVFPGRSRGDIF